MDSDSNSKHSYLIDTSVILDDSQNIKQIEQDGNNFVFITNVVLKELNKKKEERSEVGFFAREFFRLINGDNGEAIENLNFRKNGARKIKEGDYVRTMWLKYPDRRVPIFVINRKNYSKDCENNDDKILEVGVDYKLHLLTNDIAFKIEALNEGIEASSMHRDRVEDLDSLSCDFSQDLSKKEFGEAKVASKILQEKKLPDWSQVTLREFNGDIETGNKKFGIIIGNKFEEFDPDDYCKGDGGFYVNPMNLEQKFLLHTLIHPNNKVTTVYGATGSGKTLMALQAGIHLVKKDLVDGIIYVRNTVNANDKEAELGFRKGDEGQKLGYFMYPLYSAINFTIEQIRKSNFKNRVEYSGDVNTIQRKSATETFIEKHNIEIYDIAHMRGISVARKFVIFDEVQNASQGTVKLIGTRMAKDSRICFLGDWGQIDHPYLSAHRNGLVTMFKQAVSQDFVAGIRLRTTVRSEIAGWFEENL